MDENQWNGSASCSADRSSEAFSSAKQGQAGPRIALIISARDSQQTIAQAIRDADEVLATLATDYEILVVDVGSKDATAEIAALESEQRPQVKVLRQPRNLGYGAAIRRGIAAATAPLVAFTDADGQFDLHELDRLVLLSKDYDVVSGYRIDRKGSWRRKVASSCYNLLVRTLLGVPVRDCNCALKLFHREFLASTPSESSGSFVQAELLARAKLNQASIIEVGVTHRAPAAGESQVSPRQAYGLVSELLRFWWSNLFAPAEFDVSQHSTGAWSPRVELAFMSVLIVLAMFLLFGRLSYPLFEPDETRYAQIAAEMIHSDDWVTPTLDGEPYLDKPPLLYWATAISFEVFGLNEWAARFPCALSAFLTLLATYFLGKQIIGGRAASFGAAALLMCGGFTLSGRFVLMDGPLLLFTTVAMLTGYLACARTEMRIGWWVVFSLASALGILTKGPVELCLCLPPLITVLWLSNSLHQIQARHWLIMAAICMLVTIPWFVAISFFNDEFILYFFWKHNVVRFFDAFQHEAPWWFYLPIMLAGTFPASLLFPGLIPFLQPRRTADSPRKLQVMGYLMLCTVWVVLFFSLSSCKLPIYVLPAFPPLGLVLGMVLDQSIFAERSLLKPSAGFQWLPKRLAFSAVVTAAVVIVLERILFQQVQLGIIFYALAILAGSATVFAVWKTATSRAKIAWASSLAFSCCVMIFVFCVFVPAFAQTRSIHAQVAELQRQHQDLPVIFYDHHTYSAALYLNEKDVHYFNAHELAQAGKFLQKHTEVILVTLPDGASELQSKFGAGIKLQAVDKRGHLYVSHARKPRSQRVGATAKSKLH